MNDYIIRWIKVDTWIEIKVTDCKYRPKVGDQGQLEISGRDGSVVRAIAAGHWIDWRDA
jgi:hypothetical protein